MDKDFLTDRIAGGLLGLAIGDALGIPANGMTPFQVMSKLHAPIDGFFPSVNNGFTAGTYGPDSLAAIRITNAMAVSGKLDEVSITEAIKNIEPTTNGIAMFSRVAPVGFYAAMTGQDGQDLINSCKIVCQGRPKRDILAAFVFAMAIRELIRFSKEMTKPYELFDGDKSLLARLVQICFMAEASFGEDEREDLLSARLDFVRKKLAGKSCDLPRFFGLVGSSGGVAESLSISLFAYMSAPDDFATICRVVSMGGAAALHGAMVGVLIGATLGAGMLPSDMKDQVKNGVKIESLGIKFVEQCLPKVEEKVENAPEPT